ncbi:methyltransferase dimerization domain-containing protein [Streptomyces sp. NPDC048417]|uniref:methyltransferase family protein n=1 Tax=Streptomyces sp. NPDC048417 TaxID=3155387 RepID=UPI00341BDF05
MPVRMMRTGTAAFAPTCGYNQHENVTVLCFRTAHHRRFELRLPGRHDPVPDATRSLLGVMTGAWATQAVRTMAELRIADHLAARPGLDADTLADHTGTDLDALRRLLRYLATLGLLTASADGTCHLTALGEPLHTGTEFSLHPLALLYGGPFHDSFAGLTYAVRTGQEAFAHRHGQHHFTYFAEHPELGDLFHRAMAASAEMFTPVPDLVDFSGVRRVADVGGGVSRYRPAQAPRKGRGAALNVRLPPRGRHQRRRPRVPPSSGAP